MGLLRQISLAPARSRSFALTSTALLVLLAAAPLVRAADGAALSGDAERGKTLSTTCAACHGQDGATPIDPTYPVLAGQNASYLQRQLALIQSGGRAVLLMTGQLNGKSEQDLADIAAYYASLPDKVAQTDGDDATLAKAERIYRGGILDKGVAACTACHQPTGEGNGPAGFPDVGGQSSGYVVAQLTAYREGKRATDEDFGGMMRSIASRLTDTEIAALAEYLKGLH